MAKRTDGFVTVLSIEVAADEWEVCLCQFKSEADYDRFCDEYAVPYTVLTRCGHRHRRDSGRANKCYERLMRA